MKRAPERALPLFGVCLAAALGLFFAAALPLGGTLSLLAPLPVAFCYYRARPVGLAVALAGCLIVSLPAGQDPRLLALLFLELAAAGVVVGETGRHPLSPEATLLLGVLGVVVTTALIFLAHAAVEGEAASTLAGAYVEQTLQQIRDNLAGLGYGSPEEVATILEGLRRLLPAMLGLSVAAIVGLNLALLRRLLKAVGDEGLQPWPDFGHWQAPEPLIWALIGAGLLIIVGSWPARLLGLNLLLLVAVAYFFQGLAVVAFYLNKKRIPRPVRLIAYATLALQQYLSLAVALVGLTDLWIDFRRLRRAAVEEAES